MTLTAFWQINAPKPRYNVCTAVINPSTCSSMAWCVASNSLIRGNKVTQDSSRTKYMDAQEALNYGIIDKVLQNEDDLPAKPSFLASL